ncbi:MAG: WD40 repeat domain-containing protein, partial [Candidatus Sumerlaeia bacterium]|nr:WD40 repeat domain-containing protein [Candidatus Sumerlaeia bacterium]
MDFSFGCAPRRGVTFRALQGQEYRIAIDSQWPDWGPIVLSWWRLPPPDNDDFAHAELLIGSSGTVEAANLAATSEAGEPLHAGSPPDASLWWRWTAPETGRFEFQTCASEFDTVLAVYVGTSIAGLVEVAANNDCCGLQSRVEFSATAGTVYWIAIDRAAGPLGRIRLAWRRADTVPTNDAFAQAALLSGAQGMISGDLLAASLEPAEPSHGYSGVSGSLWYRWTAGRSGTVRFSCSGAPRFAVYAGATLQTVQSVDSSESSILVSVTSGASYHIAVLSGPECKRGEFTLVWSYDTPPILTVGLGTLRLVATSPVGDRYASAGGGGAFVRDAVTGEVLRRLEGHEDTLTGLEFSFDGASLATGSLDGTARVWDIDTATEMRRFRHPEAVTSISLSADATRLATGCADGIVRLWDVSGGQEVRQFSGLSGVLSAVALSPTGLQIAAGSASGAGRLWNASTGASTHVLSGHTGGIAAMRYSPDGARLATGSVDNTVRLWSPASGVEFRRFTGAGHRITSIAFAPDGVGLLAGTGSTTDAIANPIHLWNSIDGSVIATLVGGTGDVASVAFAHDGSRVIGASTDTSLRTWELGTGLIVRTDSGHNRSTVSVAFSAEGDRLFTAFDDGSIRLWNLLAANEDAEAVDSAPGLAAVAASPGGNMYAVASGDSTTKIFEVRPPRAIIVAGGGAYTGNPIARQTNDLGVYAWRTLRARGYAPEEILYLSAFPDGHDFGDGLPAVAWDLDGDGNDEVDGYATRGALQGALEGDFAREAGRLMILMIDHGYKTGDFMAFRLNPTEAVLTTTMNGWLNDLQNAAPVDVTLVVDSCYSGRFVLDCKKTNAIPAARDRIVIASTSPTAESVFLPAPDLTSFMHTFLGSAYMGNSMGEAWRSGQRFFARFPVANQRPM